MLISVHFTISFNIALIFAYLLQPKILFKLRQIFSGHIIFAAIFQFQKQCAIEPRLDAVHIGKIYQRGFRYLHKLLP